MPIYVPKAFSTNPRETYCPVCHEPADWVLMMGETHKFVCIYCQMIHLGEPKGGACVKCGCNKLDDKGVPGPEEKFACAKPCEACRERLAKVQAVVTLGGLAFRCQTCGTIGAFDKNNPLVPAFREQFPNAGDHWDLDQQNCPECKKNAVSTGD